MNLERILENVPHIETNQIKRNCTVLILGRKLTMLCIPLDIEVYA